MSRGEHLFILGDKTRTEQPIPELEWVSCRRGDRGRTTIGAKTDNKRAEPCIFASVSVFMCVMLLAVRGCARARTRAARG